MFSSASLICRTVVYEVLKNILIAPNNGEHCYDYYTTLPKSLDCISLLNFPCTCLLKRKILWTYDF